MNRIFILILAIVVTATIIEMSFNEILAASLAFKYNRSFKGY